MKNKISVTSAIGACLIVGIVALVGGISLQNTDIGVKISEQLSSFGAKENNEELPKDLDYASVERVYDELRTTYYGELTHADIMDGLKEGLTRATNDPYTTYLNEEAVKNFNVSLNQEFSGIGAEIAVKDDQLQIVAPLSDTPAERAGLRAGDLIVEIEGESTEGITVEEAVAEIRGEKGTDVTLTTFRDSQQREITITRDDIDVPNAEGEVLEGNIGYIELSTFGNDAVSEVEAIARDFQRQDVNGIVLDVRNNTGGLLDSAVKIADLWVDGQTVVDQRGNQSGELNATPGGTFNGTPTIVLINGGSASASEIVAGALQDYGLATLVGETTFGKGSVQTLENLPDGSQLKVTIARWYTPHGQNIDEEGIAPDEEVELTQEDFDNDRDPQLDKALEMLRKQ